MEASAGDIRGWVLLLAPVEGDAEALRHVLTQGGFCSSACADVRSFTSAITEDVGAVIVTEEALSADGEARALAQSLGGQPDWSDLPVILLARQGATEDTAWALARGFETVGNITILERPLRRSTLLNAVSVALRARARQYELRAHKQRLEAMVKDRTEELAESMRQLHAKERLAALGTLAAGLGHDIANLVLPIRMRLDPLATECSTDRAREDIAAIGMALNYLTNLSAGLRLMALDPSRDTACGEVDDLSRWWGQVQGILRGVLPPYLKLEGDLPSGCGVRVPGHRLTQAVFNLVQNAGEALSGSANGVVRVATEKPTSGGTDGVVRLRVSDNGPGMTPDVLGRCFEPYFSTKGRTIATGMGLSMTRGLVESAGGFIEAHSEVGRGATFTLTLPTIDPLRRKTTDRPLGARIAALSVPEPRAGAITAMLLEGMGLRIVRPAGPAPVESSLWVAQDPSWGWVEDFLSGRPGRRAVVLSSDGAEPMSAAQGRMQVFRENLIRLPLAAPPSALREALMTAARNLGAEAEVGVP